jgi:LmbE family N-acetylglucosaminyl deacetylase
MADHRAVGLAVIDGCRDAGNRWLFPELGAVGLEPWPGVRMVLVSGSPDPTHAVDTTETIDTGIASLLEHATYLQSLGDRSDPAEWLRRAAAETGRQLGCEYAVAFHVYDL